MTHSQAGQEAVKFIFNQINEGIVTFPTEITLETIYKNTGASVQCIGGAFDKYIKLPLAVKGYIARKCGSPVRIQLSKI
jgi:hypothetical protein